MRVVVSALAVIVCAWFVIGARQAHELDSATNAVTQGTAASDEVLQAAARELNSAAFLNPDQTVGVLRGRLALDERRPADARRILMRVATDEPMNLDAWIWLVGASLSDPGEARVALAQIAKLDPVDARRLNVRG